MEIKEHTFLVTITTEASNKETRAYIEEALGAWGKTSNPDNPFFDNNKKIQVTRGYRPKR